MLIKIIRFLFLKIKRKIQNLKISNKVLYYVFPKFLIYKIYLKFSKNLYKYIFEIIIFIISEKIRFMNGKI